MKFLNIAIFIALFVSGLYAQDKQGFISGMGTPKPFIELGKRKDVLVKALVDKGVAEQLAQEYAQSVVEIMKTVDDQASYDHIMEMKKVSYERSIIGKSEFAQHKEVDSVIAGTLLAVNHPLGQLVESRNYIVSEVEKKGVALYSVATEQVDTQIVPGLEDVLKQQPVDGVKVREAVFKGLGAIFGNEPEFAKFQKNITEKVAKDIVAYQKQLDALVHKPKAGLSSAEDKA